MDRTETVICQYRVKAGNEEAFLDLLRRHWPTLRALDLVTSTLPQHFRGVDEGGAPLFVEIFVWRSGEAAGKAHEHPEVIAIWEPMDRLTERRDGRPNMEFPHVQPLELRVAA